MQLCCVSSLVHWFISSLANSLLALFKNANVNLVF